MTFTKQQIADMSRLRSNGMSYQGIAEIITGTRTTFRYIAVAIKRRGVQVLVPTIPVAFDRLAAGRMPLAAFDPIAMAVLNTVYVASA